MKLVEVLIDQLYTRGKPKVSQIEEMQRRGIKTIINLVPGFDEMMVKWPHEYLHFPMADGKHVPVNVTEAAAAVGEAVDKGVALVHCRAGRNRTGLVVCTALVNWLGMTPDAAINHFRTVRPNGLANPVFEEYIRDLKR